VVGVVAVEAEVVAVRLAVTISTSCLGRRWSSTSAAAVTISARLVLAAAGTSTAILGRPNAFLLLEGPPLLGGVQQLPAGGDGVGVRRLLAVLDRLEPPGDVLEQ